MNNNYSRRVFFHFRSAFSSARKNHKSSNFTNRAFGLGSNDTLTNFFPSEKAAHNLFRYYFSSLLSFWVQQSQDLSLQHEHELVEKLGTWKEHKKCVGLSQARPQLGRANCSIELSTTTFQKRHPNCTQQQAMSRRNNESLLVARWFFRFQSNVYLVIINSTKARNGSCQLYEHKNSIFVDWFH